ncbi:MAG: septal ring lytic transglycosylase RlpA family protein [Candidatus Acidiferrales bacterium]
MQRHLSHISCGDRPGRHALFALALSTILLVVAGCTHPSRTTRAPAQAPAPQQPLPQPPPSTAPPSTTRQQTSVPGAYIEEGVASWYGYPFQGRRTSNGEVYEMHEFTAAHRTLPFNAVVRVTNLSNGKQTEVRINDRGPFVANRVIDLSLSAAQAIEMVGPGTASVRLEVISGPNPAAGYFGVQVGAFQVQENADRLKAQLESRYPPVTTVRFESANGTFYRVRVGRLPSEEAARRLAEQLHESEQFTTFVVRLDE